MKINKKLHDVVAFLLSYFFCMYLNSLLHTQTQTLPILVYQLLDNTQQMETFGYNFGKIVRQMLVYF